MERERENIENGTEVRTAGGDRTEERESLSEKKRAKQREKKRK